MTQEATTPAYAKQVTTLRLTVYADDFAGSRIDDDGLSELAAVFFEALRPAVEAFSNRHPNTIVVVTP